MTSDQALELSKDLQGQFDRFLMELRAYAIAMGADDISLSSWPPGKLMESYNLGLVNVQYS